MNTIEKYKIIQKHDVYALENEVMKLIDQGWHPVGGILLYHTKSYGEFNDRTHDHFVQSMVKYADSGQHHNDYYKFKIKALLIVLAIVLLLFLIFGDCFLT